MAEPEVLVGIQHVSGVHFSDDGDIVAIDHEHQRVHEGTHFYHKDVHTFITTALTEHNEHILTGTKEVHMKYSLAGDQEYDVYLLEAPTITVEGAPEAIWNSKRAIADGHLTTMFYDCTFTGGTEIRHGKLGAGKTTGPNASNSVEIILKPSTSYVLRMVKVNAGVGWIDMDIWFYEEVV